MNDNDARFAVVVLVVVLVIAFMSMPLSAQPRTPMQKAAAAVCTSDAVGLSITAWQMAQARLKVLHEKGWYDSWFHERRQEYYFALEAESQRGVDYKLHILECARFEIDINLLGQSMAGGDYHANADLH